MHIIVRITVLLFKSESILTANLDISAPDNTVSTQLLLSRMELNWLWKSGYSKSIPHECPIEII